jgi:hypothetical protein
MQRLNLPQKFAVTDVVFDFLYNCKPFQLAIHWLNKVHNLFAKQTFQP